MHANISSKNLTRRDSSEHLRFNRRIILEKILKNLDLGLRIEPILASAVLNIQVLRKVKDCLTKRLLHFSRKSNFVQLVAEYEIVILFIDHSCCCIFAVFLAPPPPPIQVLG
jgi:hypothetical protein